MAIFVRPPSKIAALKIVLGVPSILFGLCLPAALLGGCNLKPSAISPQAPRDNEFGNTAQSEPGETGSELGRAAQLSEVEVAAVARQLTAAQDSAAAPESGQTKYAKRLARLSKAHSAEDGLSLNFAVYPSSEVHAVAYADGSIRLSSAMLDLMRDEELLGVLGHEIGHAKLGHSARKLRLAFAAAGLTEEGLRNSASTLEPGQLAATEQALRNSPYSVHQEKEADSYALRFLAKHNYNPRGAAKALQKLAAFEKNQAAISNASSWFGAHPGAKERAERLALEIDQLKRELPVELVHQADSQVEPGQPLDLGEQLEMVERTRNGRPAAAGGDTASSVELDEPTDPAQIKVATLSRRATAENTQSLSASTAAPQYEQPGRAPAAEPAADEQPMQSGWYVQLSAETNQRNAAEIAARLKREGHIAVLQRATVRGVRYTRVLVGPFGTNKEAAAVKNQLVPLQLGSGAPFVKEIRQ